MREPSYLCSVLDDAAAVGNPKRLRLLARRWARRAGASSAHCRMGWARDLWSFACLAALERARAIELRLGGLTGEACLCEAVSESYLGLMAMRAKRKS